MFLDVKGMGCFGSVRIEMEMIMFYKIVCKLVIMLGKYIVVVYLFLYICFGFF